MRTTHLKQSLFSLCLFTATSAIAAPVQLPLLLHSNQPTPRDLVRSHAAEAEKLYPQLSESAVRSAESALRHGRWDNTVAQALPIILERAAKSAESGAAAAEKIRPILWQMQPIYGDDLGFLWVDATANAAVGDFGDARLDYDEILLHRPDLVEIYLDRAAVCGAMGSIPRMQADIAVAKSLDPKAADEFEKAHQQQIDKWSADVPKDDVNTITQNLRTTAENGTDVTALIPIADELHRAVNLHRRVPQEQYQDELRLHAAAVEANPNDPQALAEMATYIYSESMHKYGEGNINTKEWENDKIIAMQYANQALSLDPKNISAISTKGWLLEQDNQEKDALNLAQAGLQIYPGYPRLASLKDILLNVSAIRANNAAAQQRSVKSGTIFTPDYIITWSRGPTEAELEKAKEFDAMSSGNISDANRSLFDAWRNYGNSLMEMNVAARYYDYIGQDDQAIKLWQRIVQLDPNNGEAMESLEDYCHDHQDETDALQWQLRVENLYDTSANALVTQATQQLINNDFDAGAKTLEVALQYDPTNALVWGLLSRVAMKQGGADPWWKVARCGEAVETIREKIAGIDVSPDAKNPVAANRATGMLNIWKGELGVAQHTNDSENQQRYDRLVNSLTARIVNVTANVPSEALTSSDMNQRQRAQQMMQIVNQANLERMRVLLANNEFDAAARFAMGTGPRSGPWHQELYGDSVNVEFPLYQYLAQRVYPYQLWHYFGPGTVETYQGYAQGHSTVDPNQPPSELNHPNLAR